MRLIFSSVECVYTMNEHFSKAKAAGTAIGGSPARDLFQVLKFNPISWNLSRLVAVDQLNAT